MSVSERTVYELILEGKLQEERELTQQLRADLEKARAKVGQLNAVALIAAQCCIDLSFNAKEAHKEWIDGKIAKGAYDHVLSRYSTLLAALHSAGFTEKHCIYEFPMRPTIKQPEPAP